MKMRLSLLIIGCLFLASCASPPPLNYREKISSVPHTLILQDAPSFHVHSPASLLFLGGIVGAAVSGFQGRSLVRTHGIEDPAVALGAALSAELARQVNSPQIANLREKEVGKILQTKDLTFATDSKGLAVHVVTRGWGLYLQPLSLSSYAFIYESDAKLVDARSMSSVADTSCSWSSKDFTTNAQTFDEFSANGAALLKASIGQAIAHCQKHFVSFLLPNYADKSVTPESLMSTQRTAPLVRTTQ